MGFKVILTPQSLEDLEGAVRFIAKDNPGRARSFGNELIDRALSTENYPERGRLVPEISEPSVRAIDSEGVSTEDVIHQIFAL